MENLEFTSNGKIWYWW